MLRFINSAKSKTVSNTVTGNIQHFYVSDEEFVAT